LCCLHAIFVSVCSGLGYILGSSAKDAAEDWHWALRVRLSSEAASKHAHKMGSKSPCRDFLLGLVMDWSPWGQRGQKQQGTPIAGQAISSVPLQRSDRTVRHRLNNTSALAHPPLYKFIEILKSNTLNMFL